tara:strand:- start:95 stop:568 length:474 start_codon:yes stop_codon:yes gene_type:complete
MESASVRYYLFDAGDDLIASHISNESNRWLERYGEDTYWDAKSITLHVPYLDTDRDVKSEDQLPDAIGVALQTAVSTKLETCLRSFRYDRNSHFVPLAVKNRKGLVLSQSFSLLLSRTWHNVLDASASGAVLFSDGEIDKLENWTIAADLIPPYDWW